jgi:hypothetical protein
MFVQQTLLSCRLMVMRLYSCMTHEHQLIRGVKTMMAGNDAREGRAKASRAKESSVCPHLAKHVHCCIVYPLDGRLLIISGQVQGEAPLGQVVTLPLAEGEHNHLGRHVT